MNRELFETILAAEPALTRDGDAFEAAASGRVSVLLQAASGGPVPLARIKRITLAAEIVRVETEKATYTLPYGHLAGLKAEKADESRSGRAGFGA